MTYRNHCTGTAVFRFNQLYGWQVFDWMPCPVANGVITLIIRGADNQASLLMIRGRFIDEPRKGRFTKCPHKLIHWSQHAPIH